MTDLEQRKVAKEFAERWKDKGYEKGESQKFYPTSSIFSPFIFL